jgi:hypothetical protein
MNTIMAAITKAIVLLFLGTHTSCCGCITSLKHHWRKHLAKMWRNSYCKCPYSLSLQPLIRPPELVAHNSLAEVHKSSRETFYMGLSFPQLVDGDATDAYTQWLAGALFWSLAEKRFPYISPFLLMCAFTFRLWIRRKSTGDICYYRFVVNICYYRFVDTIDSMHIWQNTIGNVRICENMHRHQQAYKKKATCILLMQRLKLSHFNKKCENRFVHTMFP